MSTTLSYIGFLCLFSFFMLCAFSQGNAGGLVLLVFIVPMLCGLAKHLDDQHESRQRRNLELQKAKEIELQERARKEWEQTPEGQTYLERKRREREGKERSERERQLEETRRQEESKARALWRAYHQTKTMAEVEGMPGVEFEQFLAKLLAKMSYQNISLTPVNDQGGDIVCVSSEGIPTVVQAKRWRKSLGNAVVQELLGAMLHYDCRAGIVITNSTFTASARTLASKDQRITLCDGRWLEKQIRKYLPADVPEFSWDEYDRVVNHEIPIRGASTVKKFKKRRSRWRGKRRW